METRPEAAEILRGGHDAVWSLAKGLSDEDFARRGAIGGGEWSAKDLLGHLTSWEEFSLGLLGEQRRDEPPTIERRLAEVGGDEVNAETERRKLEMSADEIRLAYHGVFKHLVGEILAMSDEEWARETAPGETLGKEIGDLTAALDPETGKVARRFDHHADHLPDLRAYIESL